MLKPCACGSSQKDFKIDIGPFYVDECCLANGYDELGNKIKKDLDLTGLPTQEEIEAAAANLTPDLSPEPEDPPEIVDEPTKETPVTVEQAEAGPSLETPLATEETPEQKKAREKAEKKAKKDAEKAAKKAAAEQA